MKTSYKNHIIRVLAGSYVRLDTIIEMLGSDNIEVISRGVSEMTYRYTNKEAYKLAESKLIQTP